MAVTEDKATREVVAEELLRTMSGRGAEADSRKSAEGESGSDTQEIPRLETNGAKEPTPDHTERISEAQATPTYDISETNAPENLQDSNEQEQERARKLFLDHGYFDEAVQNLRAANPGERAAAARTLGLVGSQRATPHLIAAMFDDDAEVRSAAEEALSQIGDPTLTKVPAAVSINEIEKTTEAKVAESGVRPQEQDTPVLREAATSEISGPPHLGGPDAPGPSEVVDSATPSSASAASETPVQQTAADLKSAANSGVTDLTVTDDTAAAGPTEEEQLLHQEQAIRETVAELGRQILATAAGRNESELEIQRSIGREAEARAGAAARRAEEEKLRRQADKEAERRRAQEQKALSAEQKKRMQAESELERLAQEETSLRLKAANLRQTTAELARQRAESESARLEAAEAARRVEATRARDQANARHEAELDRLHGEEQALQKTSAELELRTTQLVGAREETAQATARLEEERAAVEAAREKADAEAERLVEARARMRDAEAARAQVELERMQLEADINQQVETARRQLEEARHRGQLEQERVQDETRRQAEDEQRRLAELEGMRNRAEEGSKLLAESERQTLNQIESLRISDADTRRRIEEAEVRRRTAEDAYRLVAEKVQRVEAEAHAAEKEEAQTLTKLEAERRAVAAEARSRADQEKRIREEIEMFRRLEEQERPRIEEAVLQRTEAEVRLRQRKERLKAEEDARASSEEQLGMLRQSLDGSARDFAESTPQPATVNLSPTDTTLADEAAAIAASASVGESGLNQGAPSQEKTGDDVEKTDDVITSDPLAASSVAPSIVAYLNSVDPYKRAAAVAELARSRPPDAFSLITNCFDDHSPHVRNAAARAFRKLEPNRTVDLFNKALEEASAERSRNIGGAIAASGLASEAIKNLVSENREDTYNALSILFVMAKTGEIEPLMRALEEHPDDEIGKAVTKLLTLSGHGK